MDFKKGSTLRCWLGTTELLVQLREGYSGADPDHQIQVTVLEVKTEGDHTGIRRGDNLPIEVKHFIEPSAE